MIEWFSLGCQFVTLILLGGITAWLVQIRKMAKLTNDLVGQYRREIAWVEARLEMIERAMQAKQSQKETSSK